MQFTDCQRTDNHYYSLSDRTDRNFALTDCISASILDNPPSIIQKYFCDVGPFQYILWNSHKKQVYLQPLQTSPSPLT